jgi:hypothetical protein
MRGGVKCSFFPCRYTPQHTLNALRWLFLQSQPAFITFVVIAHAHAHAVHNTRSRAPSHARSPRLRQRHGRIGGKAGRQLALWRCGCGGSQGSAVAPIGFAHGPRAATAAHIPARTRAREACEVGACSRWVAASTSRLVGAKGAAEGAGAIAIAITIAPAPAPSPRCHQAHLPPAELTLLRRC